MQEAQDVVSKEACESARERFISEFPLHGELTEHKDEVCQIEEVSGDFPADYTKQRIVASYEGVEVWMLNEDGPLQAFYTEQENWGAPLSPEEVAHEIESRMTA